MEWTDVDMVGAEEAGNAMWNFFILVVTSDRTTPPRVNMQHCRGYCRGKGCCPQKDSKKKNSHPELFRAIMAGSLARQLPVLLFFARPVN